MKLFKLNRMTRYLLFIGLVALTLLIAAFVYGRRGGLADDKDHTFSEEQADREILFDGDHIFTTKESFVQVDGNTVTIKRNGTYMLRGRLEEGQVIVDVGEDQEVKLKLNDLELSCSYGPPLYVKSADKVTLKLKAGGENVFSDGKTVDETEDEKEENLWKGCIYARSDLKIKGEGSLLVTGNHRHGIFSSKDLKIEEGNITVKAVKQALHGKKSILIEGGKIKLKAGTDAIHSNGTLDILGGDVKIDAGKYGMYAFDSIYVNRGTKDSDSGNRAKVTVVHALSKTGCKGTVEY
jgi:hypothetical protein